MDAVRSLPEPPGPMWHVTVTVSGHPVTETSIRSGLERLAHEHPFLLAGRYACDRAEVRYWEEAPSAEVVAGLALRLWQEHQETSGLPEWTVVGLEILDRETFHRRGRRSSASPGLVAAGGVTPF